MSGEEPPALCSIETPEELRIKGRRYLELARAATNTELAEAFGRWAHTLFEMADMVERGTVDEWPLH